MNSKAVFSLPEVEGDLREAMEHYASWHPRGREHFLRKYDDTVNWIEWNPGSFPRKYGRVQRAILRKSYYVAYFIQERERTLILAVLDGRRDSSAIRGIVTARKPTIPP